MFSARTPPPLRRVIAYTLGLVALVTGCSSTSPAESDLRVLFVGNSLTYANDLPAMVAALAAADGRAISYEVVAFPNFSLEDHWLEGTARGILVDGHWDAAVMQQGPSSLPESQEHLSTWTQTWADEVRDRGTAPALYMVWPAASRVGDFPSVVQSYTNAAAAADARLYPVGSAWLLAWERFPSMSLYGPDGFHPSETGSYLAALVIYGGLTDAVITDLPARLDLPDGMLVIPEHQARLLQEVAAEALAAREERR